MKLPSPFIQLPIQFDADVMAGEIAALGESVWRPHPQAFPGNSMLPLLAIDGDPADEGYSGQMSPTPELQRCPYVVQVLASLGVVLGRTRLMRLAGQAEVMLHVDKGYYWAERVRVHVPVVTQPTVRFECGTMAINMAAGECWIFDTWRQHRVVNDASQSRIHLVVDTVGGDSFWGMVARGRSPDAKAGAPWQPQFIGPDAAARDTLPLESVNVPVVMSPWEIDSHFRLILGEADGQPALADVREAARRFVLAWRALWARHGTSREAHAEYRQLLDTFLARVEPAARQVELRNGVNAYSTILTLIAKFAVQADPSSGGTSTSSAPMR